MGLTPDSNITSLNEFHQVVSNLFIFDKIQSDEHKTNSRPFFRSSGNFAKI
ncbi:MAG: hypothetical protein RI883_1147 [Bacteroidota bacterium]|jgi:hypothetical protein